MSLTPIPVEFKLKEGVPCAWSETVLATGLSNYTEHYLLKPMPEFNLMPSTGTEFPWRLNIYTRVKEVELRYSRLTRQTAHTRFNRVEAADCYSLSNVWRNGCEYQRTSMST